MSSNSRLILASSSPRRKQLLTDLGFDFEVFKTDVDESFSSDMPAGDVAEYLAVKKNKASRDYFDHEIIISADTTVVIGDQILNKPADADEAYQMIESLSEKEHLVISGYCVSDADQSVSGSCTTMVRFKPLTKREIEYYITQFKPYDKAGAYGIQEWIGLIGVVEMNGSYFNVMGLPTHRIYQVLTEKFNLWPK